MYRILVADDEPIERQVINKKINAFFPEQVEVILAENGIEAVNKYKENNCQIAVLDIEMPGMSGLEAAENIREYDNNSNIIFLTAFDEFSYAKKAIEVRALDYLLKPGSDEELIGILEEAFRICDKNENEKVMKVSENTVASENIRNCDEEPYQQPNILIGEITSYIENHYTDDIALQDIAGHLGYSDVYFCKLFKQNFGKNFITYLNEYRMNKAKELLANPLINIKDVGQKAGYRDANYFTRVFKRMVGSTPSEYRSGVLGQ
jgi:YesN/AraC family two-component response regulator